MEWEIYSKLYVPLTTIKENLNNHLNFEARGKKDLYKQDYGNNDARLYSRLSGVE